MVIDIHSHVPRSSEADHQPSPQDKAQARPDVAQTPRYTEEEFVQVMQVVDRAVVFNIAAARGATDIDRFMGSARQVNDETAAFVRKHGERFIGFLSVHPDDADCLEEIERGVSDLGLRGIKLGPNYQHFHPLSEAAFKIYKQAQARGLPIMFHQGTSPVRYAELDYAHPRHIDPIAIAFPDLKIIMAHMGHPWQIDCIVTIRKHPHVYADVSALFYRPWSYYNSMRLATEWSVLPKLLFGSDFPAAGTPTEAMAGLRKVNDLIVGTALPPVPPDAIEAIIHRNSLELLGLT